jgi:electron transport complex protein RnfG
VNIGTSGLLLAGFALFGVLLLAIVYAQTEAQIAENHRQVLQQQLNEVLKPNRYDNSLEQSLIHLASSEFDTKQAVPVYLATRQNQAIAAIFMINATRGYGGSIQLLIAVNKDQSLSGVRVMSHKETPGLGDKIELAKDNWILNFNGKSLQNPTLPRWAVKKDQGEFDQFTGATITPRAIVARVKQVLLWSQQHFDELFTGKYTVDPVNK